MGTMETMRAALQQTSDAARYSRSGQQSGIQLQAPYDSQESWAADAPAPARWWSESEEGRALLQRLAVAHLLVGVCVALALAWQSWSASGPALTPAIGLIVAVGGALALLLAHLEHPAMRGAMHVAARLALVAVDLAAAGGILWVRGGEGWTLLVLLPPIALAVAFFAERGGALATLLAAVVIVALNASQHTATAGWMPSLLVFLGVAVLVVAFLGIYSAQISETSEQLRWLLSDAQATGERLWRERQILLGRLHAFEQAHAPLLHERARHGEAAAELTALVQRMAQSDPSAAQALQTLQTARPYAYGPLSELASALARLARMPAGSWNVAAVAALDARARAQGQALETLDGMARSLCVVANELVMEAAALEPGISLIGSRQYTQALWQLEEHLRAQAAHMALLGTQLAEIRATQEHLEAGVTRAAGGLKTPPIFATSDITPVNRSSSPQVTFGASAIRRAAPAPRVAHGPGDAGGNARWADWPNRAQVAYNRGV